MFVLYNKDTKVDRIIRVLHTSMPYLMPKAKRAERVLRDIVYPIRKEALVDEAVRKGASEDMKALQLVR